MKKSMKIRLLPTKEQEEKMLKTIGCARFAWNWALNRWNETHKEGKPCLMSNIRKEFTQLKKQEEYKWLNEVSNKSTDVAMKNLDKAFMKFFNKKANYPKFKSKRKSKKSFYVRNETLRFKDGKCNIEKIGKVKYKTSYEIPDCKYVCPYCSYDGKYWYISFCFEVEENQTTLNNNLIIGIDLGIKELAVCSNGMVFHNINKSKKIKKLNKKLDYLNRQLSKKSQINNYNETNNIIKIKNKIILTNRRIVNIRKNYIHQTTNKIIKLKPSKIIMEDLDIMKMAKNKHLSKYIYEQCLHEFIRQIKYKCEYNGIEFIQANRLYPSSKRCSCCGNIKKDLKLSDRVYICDKCGLEIDRDFNASINLMNYSKV